MGKAGRLEPESQFVWRTPLQWIDEEAVIYAIVQLENTHVVTKFISEINFIKAPKQGDFIEIGIIATHFDRTSLTMRCEVRNMITREPILNIDKLDFVNLNENGNPQAHGKTSITYVKDRLNIKEMMISEGKLGQSGK